MIDTRWKKLYQYHSIISDSPIRFAKITVFIENSKASIYSVEEGQKQ